MKIVQVKAVSITPVLVTEVPSLSGGYDSSDDEDDESIIHQVHAVEVNKTTGQQSSTRNQQIPTLSESSNQYHKIATDVNCVVPNHLETLYSDNISQANEYKQYRCRKLFCDYEKDFAKNSRDLGRTDLIKHDIPTGDEPPVNQRPRRFPKEQHTIIRTEIE